MSIFDALDLIGGLSLFLFGMTLMGQALERRAGSRLKALLGRLTTGKLAGLLTGLCVTAIIQSSSATTVMVVGFVNSGLMSLGQSVHVIMGANIGTTVTAWILSLAGIDSKNVFIRLLKPSSFTPVLALLGTVLYMMSKRKKQKDTGLILLGFAVLMVGMEAMSGAVSGLRDLPAFRDLFLAFTNPFLGAAAGAVLTAVIQSSSASVGILQALASTGAVSYAAAVPIIMGQNIGTCATALLSSVGAGKNARRAALVHLAFNVIGTVIWLTVFCAVKALFSPAVLYRSADLMGIALIHSVFNVLCTLLMLPFSEALEKLVCRLIPDTEAPEKTEALDERLLGSPALALNQCRRALDRMAHSAMEALSESMVCVLRYDPAAAERIRSLEDETDRLEDSIGTYLLKLGSRQPSEEESAKATEYMKLVGDYERIADHAVNILTSAEEIREKHIVFTEQAAAECRTLFSAIQEIVRLSYRAFSEDDLDSARKTEPLEQLIDSLKEDLRTRHFLRLQRGECSAAAGFVWSDLLTDLERVSDHFSNISGCVIETLGQTMRLHENQRIFRSISEDFQTDYRVYAQKYRV